MHRKFSTEHGRAVPERESGIESGQALIFLFQRFLPRNLWNDSCVCFLPVIIGPKRTAREVKALPRDFVKLCHLALLLPHPQLLDDCRRRR